MAETDSLHRETGCLHRIRNRKPRAINALSQAKCSFFSTVTKSFRHSLIVHMIHIKWKKIEILVTEQKQSKKKEGTFVPSPYSLNGLESELVIGSHRLLFDG
jgi:hypothetical protein